MSHYVDADGHIMEKAADLIGYLEEPWRSADTVAERRLLPSLDEFHTPRLEKRVHLISTSVPSNGCSIWTRRD